MSFKFGGSGGGGGGGITPTISFLGSQSWTPAYDMEAYVYVIGAGGSGGAGNNQHDFLSGGGAGGCAISKLTLSSGTAYTITIGVGGTQTSATSQDTYTVGVDGGNTSFSGSGISTMTGNGGSGGVRGEYEVLGTLAGASGGTATGGTLGNFTGGQGGECSGISAGSPNSVRSGGGAVGLWATGNNGAVGLGNADINRFLAGGNPNYDLGTFAGDEFLNNNSYYGGNSAKAIPTISPFGMNVSAVEHHGMLPRGNYYSNGTSQHGIPQLRLTGAPQNYQGYYDNSTGLSGSVAPAFHGGYGMCGSVKCYGGNASLGGGGGAGGTRSGSTANGYGGCGGSGAVIIFPLSIGS